jgi:hypothetical protein
MWPAPLTPGGNQRSRFKYNPVRVCDERCAKEWHRMIPDAKGVLVTSNWFLVAIASAVIGYLLPHLGRSTLAILHRISRDRIKGVWYVYHPSVRDSGAAIESSKVVIRTGYYSRYVVREYKSDTIIFAKGTLSIERNFWLIDLAAVAHKEKIHIRLYDPIGTADDFTWGFFLSIDYLGNPITGPILFSRSPVSLETVMEHISKKVGIKEDMRLMMPS